LVIGAVMLVIATRGQLGRFDGSVENPIR